ncbi:NAD-dependent succinate-semialdehyde dehydrogenase [Methanotrichaceae archaeon M04Ac]|uniref:NAD-dependent succinate-semialdehyde dehydrogenase n=1 Tax=Candidatus Methanocrinis alkalitolerans TaxID=3033395 RepID=A0ABT5XFZ5_9EURY|nr:NAD-dependent succinate-semialdehyde dehydrogenase [Candidatus Methanocrinis alkalitolerans]MDF0593644.1 NAD-dependent succinate-semialdehyde dehydrogenase [Candidatus Methanocrinis alkalitolerans]
MLIDGKQVDSMAGKAATITNPATGEAVAEVSMGERADAILALEAAARAFPGWSKADPRERGDLLRRGAETVRDGIEEIARLLTMEQGKPLRFARREVESSAEALDYYAGEGERISGEVVPVSRGSRSLIIRQPLGVAAIISPWNYPADLLAWKLAPALAAGCTVVAKPSSHTPLAATRFVMALAEAGLPSGVLNLIHGSGREVGRELVESPIPRKVSFTGETDTGKWIMERAARTLKRLSLELGGSSPAIVCEDAEIDEAAAACVQRAFSNMGQICISVNRIYVHNSIAEEFTTELVRRTEQLRIGDGLDPEVDLGPIFSEAQREKTEAHIADAQKKGARILFGGRRPEGEKFRRGFFFLPTVLDRMDHSMRMMREETFGPVAPMMSFDTDEEALKLANDSRYGLAAYVFTADMTRAFWFAERLEAGSVGINTTNVIVPKAPFGGWKESGIGRERSRAALREYMEEKHIRIGLRGD